MKKEILTNSGTKHGLLAVTTLGAAEGAAIAIPWGFPASSLFGGIVGGTTAFGAEVSRRAIAKQLAKGESRSNTPIKTKNEPIAEAFREPVTHVDITVESVSTTKRTDVPEEESQPIVKTASEQATGLSIHDIPDTLASMRARTLASMLPMWQTTIQETTVASATGSTTYNHIPQRIS